MDDCLGISCLECRKDCKGYLFSREEFIDLCMQFSELSMEDVYKALKTPQKVLERENRKSVPLGADLPPRRG